MDKKSYAFGMSVASSFFQQGIHIPNLDDFVAGLKAMLTGAQPAISLEEAGEALEAFYKELEDETSQRRVPRPRPKGRSSWPRWPRILR